MVTERLVSQRHAVRLLRAAGLSRRAAYYQLSKLEKHKVLDLSAYSLDDIERLVESIEGGDAR